MRPKCGKTQLSGRNAGRQSVRSAGTPKIGSARRVIGKKLLKLRDRSGESEIVALVDVQAAVMGRR